MTELKSKKDRTQDWLQFGASEPALPSLPSSLEPGGL